MNFIKQDYKMTSEMEQKVLNVKQQQALDLMSRGKNIFLTGQAGSGKTMLINIFKQMYSNTRTIAITAMTGIAAVLIGGQTIHSYLGINLGQGTAQELTDRIVKNSKVKQRWVGLDVLIIDEISMLSPELFDKLEQIARNIRCPPARLMKTIVQPVFGGIQIIAIGDMLQIPVVNSDGFCFEAKSWPDCIDHVVELTEIMRQSDKEFQDVLSDIRFGIVSKRVKKLLKSRMDVKLENTLGIEPTKIFTTNRDVDVLNEKELDKLAIEGATFYEYNTEINFFEFVQNREQALEKYRKNLLAPFILQLCKGAQVMLTCNLDVENGLANGSRGVVIDFANELPVVRFLDGQEHIIDYYTREIEENGKRSVSITQIPLRLAWACTAHRSQGSTLDLAIVDLSNVFEYGQAYVALSRVRDTKGLSISHINFDTIRAHPKAVLFYQNLNNVESPMK